MHDIPILQACVDLKGRMQGNQCHSRGWMRGVCHVHTPTHARQSQNRVTIDQHMNGP